MNKEALKYDWATMSNRMILEGASENGERLIKLFLIDYVAMTGENVNAGCETCLNNYINNFKRFSSMEKKKNICDYELHNEYNGIPLKFGSGITVTNDNITNEYGEILRERYAKLGTSPDKIFIRYPENVEDSKEPKKETEPEKTNVLKISEDAVKNDKKDSKESKSKDVVKETVIENKEESLNLTPEQLADALGTEVVEPTVLTGNVSDIVDLTK